MKYARVQTVVTVGYACGRMSARGRCQTHYVRIPITGYAIDCLGHTMVMCRYADAALDLQCNEPTLNVLASPSWGVFLATTGEDVCWLNFGGKVTSLRQMLSSAKDSTIYHVGGVTAQALCTERIMKTVAANATRCISTPTNGEPIDLTYRPPKKIYHVPINPRNRHGCCL